MNRSTKRSFGIITLALIAGIGLSGCTSAPDKPTPQNDKSYAGVVIRDFGIVENKGKREVVTAGQDACKVLTDGGTAAEAAEAFEATVLLLRDDPAVKYDLIKYTHKELCPDVTFPAVAEYEETSTPEPSDEETGEVDEPTQ